MTMKPSPFRVATVVVACLIAVFGSHRSWAQTDESFEGELRAALEQRNESRTQELVAGNRLGILPFERNLLKEGALALDAGDEGTFASHLEWSHMLGQVFESTFAERSATILALQWSSWTQEELSIKLRADSLYDAATDIRADRDRRDEAWAMYESVHELYDEIDDATGIATVLGGLGYIAYFRDGDLAMDLNSQALEARRSIDDQQQVGNALNTIATIHRVHFGDIEKAVEFYEQARDVRSRIGDWNGLGRSLEFAGNLLYEELGQFRRGLRYYEEAADAYNQAGQWAREANALNFAGTILYDLGRPAEALPVLIQARDIYLELGDVDTMSGVVNNMGIAYRMLGDFDAAVAAYQEVIRIARDNDNKQREALALNNISVVFLWAERPERVATFAEQAQQAFLNAGDEEGALAAQINKGSALFELKQYERARETAESSLVLADSLGDVISEMEAGNLLAGAQTRLGSHESAVAAFEKGLETARYMSFPIQEFASILGMGEAYQGMGDDVAAIAHYEQAFSVLEHIRGGQSSSTEKARYLAMMRQFFEEYGHYLAELQLETGADSLIASSFLTSEKAKARAFLEEMAVSLSRVQGEHFTGLIASRKELIDVIEDIRSDIQYESQFDDADQDAIAGWRSEMEDFGVQLEDVRDQLRAQNPSYADLQDPVPVSLAEIQRTILKPGTVLLAYAVGDSSSTVWSISSDDASLAKLASRDQITASIDAYRFALSDPTAASPSQLAAAGHQLYNALVKPVEHTIDAADHLIIIPDGMLTYVPFEALVTDDSEVNSYGSIPFLLKHASISYAQSASVLAGIVSQESKSTRLPDKNLLAVGDPIFSIQNESVSPNYESVRSSLVLEPLPFTGEEVRSLSSIVGPSTVDLLSRESATEAALKEKLESGSYRFIHLATHGLIDEKAPNFSGLALTKEADSGEDGFLQASEIFNLKIDADLVVLSACDTGLGELIRGEGMIGLTRAFMFAGAPSLAVSLWKVSDRSTSELMTHFYEGMVSQGSSRASALQEAKKVLLADEKTAHPFHWAPFVLVGAWD